MVYIVAMMSTDKIIAALTGETSNAICIALTLLAWIIRLVTGAE